MNAGTASTGCGLGGILLIALTGFTEVRYTLWGLTAEGIVLQTWVSTDMDRRPSHSPPLPILAVSFLFRNREGMLQTGFGKALVNATIKVNDKVRVEYLPGIQYHTRLEGQRNRAAMWMFLSAVGFFVSAASLAIWSLVREANESVRRVSVARPKLRTS